MLVTINDERADVLSMVSLPCATPPSTDEIAIVEQLKKAMKELGIRAMGLAAPQLGVPKRIFVMRAHDGTLREFFNPTITFTSLIKTTKSEGCLSVPHYAGVPITRAEEVKLSYVDKTGGAREESFLGMAARCVQHEVNHLNGELITKYITHREIALQKANRAWKIKKEKAIKRNRAKAKTARKSRKINRN